MNSELQTFPNEQFGDLRTIEENGKTLFCAVDVAKALGYKDPTNAVKQHCDEDGVAFHHLTDKLGREQNAKFINEGNVYRLIVHSNLPSAKAFEHWVFDEVLPSIRRNGGYIAGQEEVSDDELFARAILVAQRKIEEKDQRINALEAENKVQAQQIAADAPKVVFANAVATSKSSILVGDLAKLLRQNGIEMGQKRLFTWLRDNGYLMKRGESYNMPTQQSMERGLFEIKEGSVANPDGSIRVTRTVKCTGKGQQYFVNLFLNKATDNATA